MVMNGKLVMLACSTLLASVAVAGIAAAANSKIAVCAGCHGKDGNSVNPTLYPNLTGQSEAYLTLAIKSYKDGSRSNGPMKIMVDTLTDQDISELAAFFASQRCR